MAIADLEKTIRDQIITILNAETTTQDAVNGGTAVSRWGKDSPLDQRRGFQYPYGYVKFIRKLWDPEHSTHAQFEYIFTYEIGVTQRRQAPGDAQDYCTDILAKVENELRTGANTTLGGNVRDRVFPAEKETRDIEGAEYIAMFMQFRAGQDSRV